MKIHGPAFACAANHWGIMGIILVLSLSAHAEIATADLLRQIGFDQKLNSQTPLDTHFQDERGNDVELGDYFHDGRPVVLVLGYYGCPMLCTQILNGLAGAVKGTKLKPGSDFEIVMVSIDPSETPQAATAKKNTYIASGDASPEGWHFLTGKQAEIDTICGAAGFRYSKDGNQFAHPSGIVVLTPQGLISRYLLGIEFPPRELRLALVEASKSRIGSLSDQVLLLCYRYDPTTGKYGFAIIQTIRVAGVLTVLALGAFVSISLWRDKQRRIVRAH